MEVIKPQSVDNKDLPKRRGSVEDTENNVKQTFNSILMRDHNSSHMDNYEKYSVNDVVTISKPVDKINNEAQSILDVYENSFHR